MAPDRASTVLHAGADPVTLPEYLTGIVLVLLGFLVVALLVRAVTWVVGSRTAAAGPAPSGGNGDGDAGR